MYPKFIEVHLIFDGILQETSVNVDSISCFADKFISCDGIRITVTESYDELKQLITDAGCIIAKPDPRLDMTKPLTMDDLKEMIGEPVWDSNSGEWMLFEGFSDNNKLARFQQTGCTRKFVSEQELIKFPMYRMKVV